MANNLDTTERTHISFFFFFLDLHSSRVSYSEIMGAQTFAFDRPLICLVLILKLINCCDIFFGKFHFLSSYAHFEELKQTFLIQHQTHLIMEQNGKIIHLNVPVYIYIIVSSAALKAPQWQYGQMHIAQHRHHLEMVKMVVKWSILYLSGGSIVNSCSACTNVQAELYWFV